jgi:hypothetical protein
VIDTIQGEPDPRRQGQRLAPLLSEMTPSEIRDFVDSLDEARRSLDPVELVDPDLGTAPLDGDARDSAVICLILKGKVAFDDARSSTRVEVGFDDEMSESFLEVVASAFEDKTGEGFDEPVDFPVGYLSVHAESPERRFSREALRGGQEACAVIEAHPELRRLLQQPGAPNSFLMVVFFVSPETGEHRRLVRSGDGLEATESIVVPLSATFEDGWLVVKNLYERAAKKFGLPRIEAL